MRGWLVVLFFFFGMVFFWNGMGSVFLSLSIVAFVCSAVDAHVTPFLVVSLSLFLSSILSLCGFFFITPTSEPMLPRTSFLPSWLPYLAALLLLSLS
jgi:hypothetical protein